jgi:nucleoside-diphosphate-sugar epimerase
MRVVVTGAGGFVGGYVVRELLARGHRPLAVVRPGKPLPPALTGAAVEVCRANLSRPPVDLVAAVRGADAVIHLAAGTTGSARERFEATVLATEKLFVVLRASGFGGRFVHVSSLAVYGFNQVSAGAVIDETTPLEPLIGRRDDYAWTKLWQERVVRDASANGRAEAVIVRPGAIYGPERRFQQRLGRRIGKRTLLLIGGLNRMPLNYVENTASLLAECAVNPRAAGEVFNAIDPYPPRQATYLRALRRVEPLRVVPVPGPVMRALGAAAELASDLTDGVVCGPGMLDRYTGTPNFGSFRYAWSKPTQVLDWRPPFTRAEALRRTFAAERDRGLEPQPERAGRSEAVNA